MAGSLRIFLRASLLGLLLAEACAPVGQKSAANAGFVCARSQAQRDALLASARLLSDTIGSSSATGSRQTWPFLGAAPSEIHIVEDDELCRRVLHALRSAHGVKADSVAAVEVRGAYVVFVVPPQNATYVLDRELRVLDVLIVPS